MKKILLKNIVAVGRGEPIFRYRDVLKEFSRCLVSYLHLKLSLVYDKYNSAQETIYSLKKIKIISKTLRYVALSY